MPLTGSGLLVLIAVVIAAAVAAAVVLRRWWRVGSSFLALVAVVLFAAAVVNDHFSFYTSWRDILGVHSRDLAQGGPQTLAPAQPTDLMTPQGAAAVLHPQPGHGALMETAFPSRYAHVPTHKGFVYLPPQYFDPAWAGVRFPVVELLHGAPGAPANWVVQIHTAEIMDAMIAQHRVGPMVLVSADYDGPSRFHSTECVNAVGGLQMDTYVTSDVRYDVVSALRVANSRSEWGLAGFSTGGFCAINLALRHPSLYSATAVMDGYFHAIEDHFASHLYQGNTQVRRENTPMWTWLHRPDPQLRPLHIFLLASKQDPDALVESVRFHDLVELTPPWVRRWSMAFQLQTSGGHNFASWRQMTPSVLAWSWSQLAPPALQQLWPTLPTGLSDVPPAYLDRIVTSLVHRVVPAVTPDAVPTSPSARRSGTSAHTGSGAARTPTRSPSARTQTRLSPTPTRARAG